MLIVDALQAEMSEVQTAGAEGVEIKWLIDESHGAPNFAMRCFVVQSSGCTPWHEHDWEHEVYVLRGRGLLVTQAGEHPLHPDMAVLVAPGEQHNFRCVGDKPLELLCLVPNGPATVGH